MLLMSFDFVEQWLEGFLWSVIMISPGRCLSCWNIINSDLCDSMHSAKTFSVQVFKNVQRPKSAFKRQKIERHHYSHLNLSQTVVKCRTIPLKQDVSSQ